MTPEERARVEIDKALRAAGWIIQDRAEMNVAAGRGVAVREFALASGHGEADYLLFVDERAVGAFEAKPEGHTPSGVERQAEKYSKGLPAKLDAPVRPLPFLYIGTGTETTFTSLLDPEPRSRPVFAPHRPEVLADWLAAPPLAEWTSAWTVRDARSTGGAYGARSSSLRARVRAMPPLSPAGLWPAQMRAITNLEQSLAENRPRALIQMATGSGKTLTAIHAIYRLIRYGGARRVLFLVDRKNLGIQAEKEFQGFKVPDGPQKFTQDYNVQLLKSNMIPDSSKVVITTIQRLYAALQGEPELPAEAEEGTQFGRPGALLKQPAPVAYSPGLPVERFDVIFVDECHRSIYTLWRQVLDYFDAFVIGLTATPGKHTLGFFNQNLVMEYGHEAAVGDRVNVDYSVYNIRTRISQAGSTIEAGPAVVVPVRERRTRAMRLEVPDDDITYGAPELDRSVVAKDQIRLIVKTFKERVRTEIFPGRTHVPKTVIFAKDDSHAEDILGIVREEFGKGNDFAQKITYRTTGADPEQLIQDFRNSYNPRIAVTVDMIATGTDIKPIEVVMFMRQVRSRTFFEQMKGRGVRVISTDELRAVTPDAPAKTHFVIVDCVGACEHPQADTYPLDRKPGVSLAALLEHVGAGGTDAEYLSSIASRLARLDAACDDKARDRIAEAAGGVSLRQVAADIVAALDPDRQAGEARAQFALPAGTTPAAEQIQKAATTLLKQAVRPLATRPKCRTLIVDTKRLAEQVIDEVSKDELLEAGFSASAKDKARGLVESFEQFLRDNRDEIAALQVFFSKPHKQRLRFDDIRALADAIGAPPRGWTAERLWRAYEALQKDRVRGASAGRLLTDVVSLVRFALKQAPVLEPYADRVRARYEQWIAAQAKSGRAFSPEQQQWLEMIRDHVATSVEIEPDDFDLPPFAQAGGLARATQVFGKDLQKVVRELGEVLAA